MRKLNYTRIFALLIFFILFISSLIGAISWFDYKYVKLPKIRDFTNQYKALVEKQCTIFGDKYIGFKINEDNIEIECESDHVYWLKVYYNNTNKEKDLIKTI